MVVFRLEPNTMLAGWAEPPTWVILRALGKMIWAIAGVGGGTEGLTLAEALRLALGLIEADWLPDSDSEADTLVLGDWLALGDTEADGLWLGDSLADGL